MVHPSGKKQLTRSILSPASLDSIWKVLVDTSKLPHWAPPVESLERCEGSGETIGAVRVCKVSLAGRSGTIVERIVDMKERSYITYVVDDDSFGMSKMFADYAFRLSVCQEREQTRITSETFYTPRNPIYTLMNLLIMKRQFSAVVDGILDGLSNYASTAAMHNPAVE